MRTSSVKMEIYRAHKDAYFSNSSGKQKKLEEEHGTLEGEQQLRGVASEV